MNKEKLMAAEIIIHKDLPSPSCKNSTEYDTRNTAHPIIIAIFLKSSCQSNLDMLFLAPILDPRHHKPWL